MSETLKSDRCLWTCWAISAGIGLVVAFQVTPGVSMLAALMFSLGLAVLTGVALTRMICFDKGMARNFGLVAGLEIDDSFKAPQAQPAKPAPAARPQASAAARADEIASQQRPAGLTARPDTADDLTRIKGIGPKLERLCHDLGIYHYDQIARWTAAEVAWMDSHLTGFRGRVSRDDWVAQARRLAAPPASDTETQDPNRVKENKRGAERPARINKTTGGY